MNKILVSLVSVLVFAAFVFGVLAPAAALAQTAQQSTPTQYLEQTQQAAGYKKEELPTFIGRIIKWVLGVIGVILIVMFVYGGVMYATSAGNDERVESGKKIMIYAVVGALIVALAYVASDFVVRAFFQTTTTGGAPGL